MTPVIPRRRRFGGDLARAGIVLAAAFLVANQAESHWPGRHVSLAAVSAGTLRVVVPSGGATQGQSLTQGGSATAFDLVPPLGAACTGDSAKGGYRIQSYMVPSNVDPATLTYDANGPIPNTFGANYRQPLFTLGGGSPFVDGLTAVAAGGSTAGLLTGLPSFGFDLFGAAGPTVLPNGTYNLGYACTLGTASATQVDKFWNIQFTVTANAADVPSGITWAVVSTTTPTTTTATTVAVTTTTATATTTTAAPTTTTATATTTTAAATTTTATATTTTAAATTTTAAPTTTTAAATTTTASPTTTITAPTTTTPTPDREREVREDREDRRCGQRGRGRRDRINDGRPCPRPVHESSTQPRDRGCAVAASVNELTGRITDCRATSLIRAMQ